MKAIITKIDVSKAIDSLKAADKKPTIAAIHAALGNKGSISTLLKLKAELEAEAVNHRDSEDGLRAFREIWALAVEEGRAQKAGEVAELHQALEAVSGECQKLEGEHAAALERLAEVEKQRDGLVAELTKATEQVTAARAAGESHATKAAEVLERMSALQTTHATETTDLRQQLSEAQKALHATELKLARAETKLEKK